MQAANSGVCSARFYLTGKAVSLYIIICLILNSYKIFSSKNLSDMRLMLAGVFCSSGVPRPRPFLRCKPGGLACRRAADHGRLAAASLVKKEKCEGMVDVTGSVVLADHVYLYEPLLAETLWRDESGFYG